MKILTLSLMGLLLISIGTLSFAQTDYDPGLTVNTDDKSYDEGETIEISGKVSLVIEDIPVIIELWKEGEIKDISQIDPDQFGNYSHTIIAEGQIWTQGTYVIRASYGEGNIAETNFTFGNFESAEESTEQTANSGTSITIVMDEKKFFLDSPNRIIRATVEIREYTPSDGIYFLKVTHIPTQKVLKNSEIYPSPSGNDLWAAQIAYPFLESDITIGNQKLFGEFEMHIRTEFGSQTANTKFSIYESQYGPESMPKPEPVAGNATEAVVDNSTEAVVDNSTEAVVDNSTEAVVEDTPEAVVASTPEIIKENENIDSTDEVVQSEESAVDFTSILPYLGILIAAIIAGVVAMKIRNNKKGDELSEDYEYNAEEYSVIENAPLTKKFQEMQADPLSDNKDDVPISKVIETKIQIISILQENKIGDNARLESIKISLLSDGSFTQEDNEYLEAKYEEFKKTTKKDSKDKSK